MNKFQKSIKTYSQNVADAIDKLDSGAIQKVIDILLEARARGSMVWIVGNGGSASTASHFANDLTKMAGLRAISIPDLTPLVLAYGNDEGWDDMFWNPIQALRLQGDVIISFSCSGNSVNAVNAIDMMGSRIVFTGNEKNSTIVSQEPNAIVFVESDDIKVQEDVHLHVCHMIAGIMADEV